MLKCEPCNWTKCLCFNIFFLPRSLHCDCKSCAPSRLFCVCVCVCVKYLCIALLMCFGDAPVVRASLPPSLFPSHSCSIRFVSLVHIFCCLALFFKFCLLVFLSFPLSVSSSLSVRLWSSKTAVPLTPLSFHKPSIFQDCLKIDSFAASSQCTCRQIQANANYFYPCHPSWCSYPSVLHHLASWWNVLNMEDSI